MRPRAVVQVENFAKVLAQHRASMNSSTRASNFGWHGIPMTNKASAMPLPDA
jgi:hypothetical protein